MQAKKSEISEKEKEMHGKLLLYAIVAVIILVLAILSTLFVHTSPLKQCLNIVIQQNKIGCLLDLANSTSNASICNYLNGSYQAQCYNELAQKLDNATLCSRALDVYGPIGAACVEGLVNKTRTISLCNLLPGKYIQSCFFKGAVSTRNITACSFTGRNSGICTSSISFSDALLYGNIAYCYNVSDSANTTEVTEILSNLSTTYNQTIFGALTMLSSFGYSPSARDLCMINTAQELGNASYCSLLASNLSRSLCLKFVYPRTASTTPAVNYTALLQSCANAGSYSEMCRNYVLISEAISTKNIQICKSLNQTLSFECFAALAQTYKNASYCGYITNATLNSACLLSVSYNATNIAS